MSSEEQPSSENQTDPDSAGTSRSAATGRDGGQLALRPVLAMVVALLGAIFACGVLSASLPMFRLSGELIVIASVENPPAEQAERLRVGEFAVARNNAMFAMATVGLFLGGLLGLAEGLARRSAWAAILVGSLGLVLGVLFGGLGGMLGHLAYNTLSPMVTDFALARTIGWQAAMTTTLGLGIGLALTLPLKNLAAIINGMLGGALGGALAAVLVPPLAAFAMTDVDTESLIPSQAKLQFVWLGVTGVLTAAAITGLGKKKSQPSAAVENK